MLDNQQRRIALNNALVNIHHTVYTLINKPDSWDKKIEAVRQIQRLIPDILRCMLYFKNTEDTHNGPKI